MNNPFLQKFQLNLPTEAKYRQKTIIELIIDYFNQAAGSHSSSLGFPLEALFKKGFSWILLSWNISIQQLPETGEEFLIETWISHVKRCFAFREFQVKSNQGHILIKASSQWVFYNIKLKRPSKIFPELADQWTVHPVQVCTESLIQVPLTVEYSQVSLNNITVQPDDIDYLDHVHNSKYIQWTFLAKPKKICEQYQLKHLEIHYYHEIKYPGEVIVRQRALSPESDSVKVFYDQIWDESEKRISTVITSKWEPLI